MATGVERLVGAVAVAGLGGAFLFGPADPGTRRPVAPAPVATLSAAPTAQDVPANPERNAYFGDVHVHSSWSLDAYTLGGNRDEPDVAYRFGRGDTIRRPDGSILGPLAVPLDFMAVTDHDAWLGEVHSCVDTSDQAYDTPTCRQVRAMEGFGQLYGRFGRQGLRPPDICGESGYGPGNRCLERAGHLWHEIQKNADAFYEPGTFTTFAAYEWTGQPPGIGHLHRNVIFRGEAVPEWGGSAVEMQNRPERLWEWLEKACVSPCQVMSIPHNTNWSEGVSMAPNNSDGSPFTEEILKRRAWAEPLVEVFQIKGGSECYTGLGTTDEECGFEKYYEICKPGQGSNCAYASDYVRNALKSGLRIEEEFGVNPFKYGLIASPDGHKSTPGDVDEDAFVTESPKFAHDGSLAGPYGERQDGGNITNPGGLVGVWADRNTRESIFDAMKRKETFATSGPRIHVRFFGGWAYPNDLHSRSDVVGQADAGGVPMGGDLPSRPPTAGAPRFVVWATKDARSANLQKVQIVKGWSSGGETHERVYDVACADGLTPDPNTHTCTDNGARVDVTTCNITAGKGAAQLSTTWTDPEFSPADRAFYYVRVLENPTCRWTTHRALARKSPIPEPSTIKERAWSSPIWYTPPSQ
ncbi:MAG: DUF3604 domain-containing protein [Acidimicrobiia bacterium]|nr:DUF3604 domain-containing protein [Acidimicrobiia bacterium]